MLDRMTLIIDTIGGGNARLGVDVLARRTGLPRSTVRGILEHLVRLQWVTVDAGGYGIGPRLGGVVSDDRAHGDLRAAAAEPMRRLHLATGLVAHLARHTGTSMFYLDKVGVPAADHVPTRVGGREPLHATALGKATMAWWAPEEVDEVLAGTLAGRTRHTIGSLAVLHEELARIRTRGGLAHDRGEHTEHIACVAAAIRADGARPVAALSLTGRDFNRVAAAAPLVRDAARQISRELFPAVPPQEAGTAPAAESTERVHAGWSPSMLEPIVARGHHDWT